MKLYIRCICVISICLFITRCEDDGFINDENAKLAFSTDTVFFDTVFTTIGTRTERFKIYNNHNKSILISEIYLAGGVNSIFRLNIDGEPTRKVTNKKIGPKDSLFVFVEATVNPNGDTLPIVVKDSVVFITNNNIQDVKLIAWGQDMHYYKREIIKSETWDNDKPYLIYDYIVVDSNEILTINEGVKVYLHWNSSIIVWGTLKVNGTAENPVIFQGDRLEWNYQDIEGQWGTIAMVERSKDNLINHAIIKNAIIGLWFGQDTILKKVEADIKNTIIMNTSGSGIVSFGANINVYNTVVGKSAQSNVMVFNGGKYNFYHCTFSNYYGQYPSVVMSNYLEYKRKGSDKVFTIKQNLEQANFYNSIVYGNYSKNSEIAFYEKKDTELNYKFDHCLLKLIKDSFETENTQLFNKIIYNKDPKLINNEDDFHIDTLSPAKDAGSAALIENIPDLLQDIMGNSRLNDAAPDLGAYERIENE